jgi:hypothetical protein
MFPSMLYRARRHMHLALVGHVDAHAGRVLADERAHARHAPAENLGQRPAGVGRVTERITSVA